MYSSIVVLVNIICAGDSRISFRLNTSEMLEPTEFFFVVSFNNRLAEAKPHRSIEVIKLKNSSALFETQSTHLMGIEKSLAHLPRHRLHEFLERG